MERITTGTKIRTLRVMRGYSQSELAKLIGLRQSLVSDIEIDRVLPGTDILEAIEAALGLRFDAPAVEAAFAILAGHDQPAIVLPEPTNA